MFLTLGDGWYRVERMLDDRGIGEGPAPVCSKECGMAWLSEQIA